MTPRDDWIMGDLAAQDEPPPPERGLFGTLADWLGPSQAQAASLPRPFGKVVGRGGEAVGEASAAERGGVAGGAGGEEGLRQAGLEAERRAGGRLPLPGLPTGAQTVEGKLFIPGPVGSVHDVADRYMAGRNYGVAPPEKFYPLDKERARAIAQEYDRLPMYDPAAVDAYNAMIRETLAQYQAIRQGGLKLTPVGAENYPYGSNPRAVAQDVGDRGHMAFFKTEPEAGAFGSGGEANIAQSHPLLKPSGEYVGDYPMLNNDLFRVVHDYFGHIKHGYGFRAAGEDNAWRAHAAMYSPQARPAMTSETRGQNSWVNYGPHGDFNRTASGADTIYSPQKVGLMPAWTMDDLKRYGLAGATTMAGLAAAAPGEAQAQPMGALAREDNYAPTDEELDRLRNPPMPRAPVMGDWAATDRGPILPDAGGAQLGAIGNVMRRLAPKGIAAAEYYVGTPSRAVAGPNIGDYPPGSEEAEFLRQRHAKNLQDWSQSTALGMVADPLTLWGMRGTVGSGAGSKIIQPQPKMGDLAGQTKLPLNYQRQPTPVRVLTEAERDAPFPNAPFPQYAREYPPSGYPVEKLRDPKKPELGTYPSKALSPEGEAFAAARLKIRRDVEKGDYPRYYDPAQRFYVPERPEYAPNIVTATDPALRPAKQATIDRQLEKLGADETRQALQNAHAKGLDLGNAEHWYAMGQLEADYVRQLGPKEGPKAFRDRFVAGMAATTSGQAPTENLMMGHYLNYLEQTGRPMPRASWDTPPSVGGQYTMGGVENYQKMRQGGGYPGLGADQPKMHNFGQNIMGNLDPATLDKQMSVGMTSTPHFKKPLTEPQWFGLQEQVLAEEAAKLGVKPGNLQDVAWAGFKGEPGMPLIEHYNQAIERGHRLTGMPRREIAEGLISGTIPMYGVAGAVAVPALGDILSRGGGGNTRPRPDRYLQ